MFPWWLILLIVIGIIIGIYFLYSAYVQFTNENEDVIETSAAVVLGSISLGLALLPLVAIIFG